MFLILQQYRAVLIAVGIAIFGFGCWHTGAKLERANWQAEKLRMQAAAQKEYDAKAEQYNEASAALEVARNERQIVTQTIEKQVEKVVTRDVYRNVCLDDDGVRLVNDAIEGRSPDPAELDAGMPDADKAGGQDGQGRGTQDGGVSKPAP